MYSDSRQPASRGATKLEFGMSFSVITVNLVKDLKIIFTFGTGRSAESSLGGIARGLVALGLMMSVGLIVGGFFLAGITTGVENPPPLIKTVYTGMIGGGIVPAFILLFVYYAMGGGDREGE